MLERAMFWRRTFLYPSLTTPHIVLEKAIVGQNSRFEYRFDAYERELAPEHAH